MKIEHIAIWVQDLERMKDFYQKYFKGTASELYYNKQTGFKSYFIKFTDGSRLEIMTRPDIKNVKTGNLLGYAHISISLGSKESVDKYTEKFEANGYSIMSKPRTTGDGYYESTILDPEGNLLELTI